MKSDFPRVQRVVVYIIVSLKNFIRNIFHIEFQNASGITKNLQDILMCLSVKLQNQIVLTQFFNEFQHYSSNMKVTLHSKDPLNLQVCDMNVQLPRAITNKSSFTNHVWNFEFHSLFWHTISIKFTFSESF